MKKTVAYLMGTLYFMVCFWVIMDIKALAYVDATSVTYVIQAIVGIFVAIGAVVTVQRHKIVAAYRKWHYGKLAKKNALKQLEEAKTENNTETNTDTTDAEA
ncbi:MAG: hypothetical protein K6G69_00025 [Lachnospiraceae bacterium]|nr:hypothetical protein [Lachnospiraceae bacterium]